MIAAVLAGTLAAAGFLVPTPVLFRLDEQSDDQAIVDACRFPAGEVELHTRSNMITAASIDALRRCRAPRVTLQVPLARAHLEQLERVPRAEPVFELGGAAGLSWAEVSRLGPRRIHVRVVGELTADRAKALAGLRDAEVELDLRGRIPRADELALLAGLDRVGHSLRLGPDAPPEMVKGLRDVHPSALIVETRDNRLPPDLLRSLADSDLPVRISLTWPFPRSDLEPLLALPRLSLEIQLGQAPGLSRQLKALLELVGPAAGVHAPSDGGFSDPLQDYRPPSPR